MRHAWIFALVACGKSSPHAATGSAAGSAAVAGAVPVVDASRPADAAGPLVELLHAVPASVRVSSRVKNDAIKPEHLVDRDLQTAWNSATGELVGAWIEVSLPAGAELAELRLTVGHTGKGPRGEDYFTMNPRIKRVSVLHGEQVVAKVALDPARRELQRIAARATGTVRIVVDEIVAGSKKAWRETCISELEAWGTPPAGWTPPAAPLVPSVTVEPPPEPPPSSDPCAGTAEAQAAHEAYLKHEAEYCATLTGEGAQYCGLDTAGGPVCNATPIKLDGCPRRGTPMRRWCARRPTGPMAMAPARSRWASPTPARASRWSGARAWTSTR